MAGNESLIRFEKVSYSYTDKTPILAEVDFSVRRGSKITIMGQNGAGKSTILKLISGELSPVSGRVLLPPRTTIGSARQVVPRAWLTLTVREFFEKAFSEKIYDIDPRITEVLEVVNLHAPLERTVGSFSGGQQARLLLAFALITNPDILLLDEPTNNLDHAGIEHLRDFIKGYKKTCLVISHDAEFLNSFTEGVLYLNVFTQTVEQYTGNYYDVGKEIAARLEKERMQNARLEKTIQEKKDKANFFAHKGGNLRLVARRMRELAEELEEEKVEARKEDKTIRPFTIPSQPEITGELLKITQVSVIKNHEPKTKKVAIALKRKQHIQLVGPNGIGKTTLLETLAKGDAEGVEVAPGVRIGYYSQDFRTLNYDHTVYESLESAMERPVDQTLRATGASFLLSADILSAKVGAISEGQKGLLSFARLVLLKPGVLILDEPTNHINFRHLPVIAKALHDYDGGMILVSHVPDFAKQIRIDEVIDLSRL